jgi:Cu2+-exporting ATPase
MIHLVGLALYVVAVSGVAAYKKNAAKRAIALLPVSPQPADGAVTSVTNEDTPERVVKLTAEEAAVNRNLAYSGTALALSAAGMFIYPPLGVASLLPLALSSESMLTEVARRLKNREKNIIYLDTIAVVMGIATGYYALSALTHLSYIGSQKMLLQTRDKTQKHFANLFASKQQDVWLLQDDAEICVKLESVKTGDRIVVNTGEIIPVDGIVVGGMATIDQHMLTGESQPEEKSSGERVMATTLVVAGRIIVKIERAGSDTIAAQIAASLDKTEAYINDIQTNGEILANKTVTPTVTLAGVGLLMRGATTMGLALSSNFSEIMRISQPMAMLNYLNIASSGGVLVKDGRSLEQLQLIDTVIFDKTGTLTNNQPHIHRVVPCRDYSENDIVYFAATAEYRQTHPIARAVEAMARSRGIELHAIDEAEYRIGLGLTVVIAGCCIKVGSRRFMAHEGVPLEDWLTPLESSAHEVGHSLLYVAVGDLLAGVLELAPTIRPEAATVVRRLHARGLRVVILSGDHVEPVRKLAADLGIDEFHAQTLPEQKAAIVERMHEEGRHVCFVGDGINDSIALKRAAVSVSIQDGSDIARDSAQIVLMGDNLLQLLDMLDLADEYKRQQKIVIGAIAAPSVACVGGVLLFGFTMPYIMMLYLTSAVAGVTCANAPLLRKRKPKSAPLLTCENEPLDTLGSVSEQLPD